MTWQPTGRVTGPFPDPAELGPEYLGCGTSFGGSYEYRCLETGQLCYRPAMLARWGTSKLHYQPIADGFRRQLDKRTTGQIIGQPATWNLVGEAKAAVA